MKLKVLETQAPLPFEQWKQNWYSQNGEDGIISEITRRLGVDNGYFVEFGAWDGKHLSNCARLAELGWAGCFIEGDATRHLDLIRNYSDKPQISAIHAMVGTEGENALSAILDGVGAPRNLTVLSIDIDGNDYYVWEALEGYKPNLCIIEFNPTVPSNVIFVQSKGPLHQGCSLAALCELGKEKGYSLVATTELNGFFVPTELCQQHLIPIYSAHEAKDRSYEAYLFHGYDGSMTVAGCRKLIWHGVEYGPRDLQLLPTELHRFPVSESDEFYTEMQAFRDVLGKREH